MPTIEQLEKQRELLGLPSYVEQMRRQSAGESTVTPLEVLGALTRPIESVTAAPARAAVSKLQEGAKLSEVIDAFKSQMGKPPETAPTGEALATKTGLQGIPAKAAGLGLDLAIDPTNLLGAGVAKASIPLLGLVGAMKAQKEAKAAEVLAKPGALGFYSKLEDLVLQKMGKSATPEQVMAIAKEAKAEEVAAAGLEELLKGKDKITKEEVLGRLAETRPQLQEVVRGGVKGTLSSTSPYYDLPEVRKIAETEQGAAGVELALANDGDAYRALSKKFPEVMKNENWAELIVQDIFSKAKNKEFKPTRFESLQMPGGKNYREVLITLPEKQVISARFQPKFKDGAWGVYDNNSGRLVERSTTLRMAQDRAYDYNKVNKSTKTDVNFRGSHWDEPNVLAHARTNERVDTSGNKLFHIEEIQSDWHQAGRKKGYKSTEITPDFAKNFFGIKDELWQTLTDAEKQSYVDEIKQGGETVRLGMRELVPDAPFKKSWQELTAKKMIQDAVASGADRMSWTPGAVQAERYDLSKQVKEIDYIKQSDGTFELGIADLQGNPVALPKTRFSADELPDVVGKEVAEKIIKDEGKSYRGREHKTLEGVDLKVGGEGQKGFYDKILPDFLRKFGKKYGAEVGETTIESEGKKIKVPYLNLTPELKAAVIKEGLPLFSAGAIALPAVVEQMRKQQEAR